MEERHQHLYEFGPFCLDTRERVLRREGSPLQLKPKVYETLLALVSRSGHIVDKEELMRRVWPDVVVEENNLTGNIFALRRALAEHRYIETVPRRGYRFTAEVREVQVEDVRVAGRLGAETEVLIKEIVGTSGQTVDSLAVLPFVNMSADPENEYFCDGLAEELLNALANIDALKVAARTSSFSFKGKNVNVDQIGRALHVRS